METERLDRRDLLLVVMIFTLALIARIWYVFYTLEGDKTLAAQANAGIVEDICTHLANEQSSAFAATTFLGQDDAPTAWIAPGYALLVGTIRKWIIADVAGWRSAVLWLQVVVSALTCVAVYFLARRVFRHAAVATLAGVLSAFHLLWIRQSGLLTEETCAALLFTLTLLAAYRMLDQPSFWAAMVLAIWLGLLVLLKPVALVLVPCLLVSLAFRMREERGLVIVALVLAVGPLLPWTARNWLRFGEWIPVTTSWSYHLWCGNNDHATGGPVDRKGRFVEQSLTALERYELAERSEPERSRWFLLEAWDWISSHPTRWVQLRAKALVYFWTGQQFWLANTHGTEPIRSLPAWWCGLFGLALLGLHWSHRWRPRTGLLMVGLLCWMVPYVIGCVDVTREMPGSQPDWLLFQAGRLPLDGLLIIWGAFAILRVLPGVGDRLKGGPAPTSTTPREARIRARAKLIKRSSETATYHG